MTATVRLVGVAGRRTALTGVLARSVALAGAAQRTVRLSGVVGPFVPYVPPEPIYTHLLAWWALDEATGQARADSHGGYTLADATGATPRVDVAKQAGGAGMRAGGGHYLYSASAGLDTLGQPFALAGWFRVTAANQFPILIARNNGPLTNRDFELNLGNGNFIGSAAFYVRSQTIGKNGVADFGIAANAWHFFFAAYEILDAVNARLILRVNATQFAQTIPIQPAITASPRLTLGRRDGGNPAQFWSADLDEIAYWRGYVPSATEVDRLYNAGVGRNYAAFAAQYGGGG